MQPHQAGGKICGSQCYFKRAWSIQLIQTYKQMVKGIVLERQVSGIQVSRKWSENKVKRIIQLGPEVGRCLRI